ncbi:MAG: TonB family protein [Pseudomonadota bacterium]|nr:TonB family protein [Pseudomonadota bacterium]MEE2788553.1 TonB family protein [Myxococcota bacterium]
MATLLRHFGAAVIMVLGAGSVMFLLVMMNAYQQPPEKSKPREATTVTMAPPKPKPKKQPKRVQKQKPKPRPKMARTPPPQLATGLSSVSLGAPSSPQDLGTTDGSELLGANASKKLVMTTDTVDEPPVPIQRVPARYPPSARRNGITGHVSFSLTIGPTGRIIQSRVIESKPVGIFDQVAQDAMRQWRFRPGRYRGEAQTVVVEQTMRFALTRGG